MGLISYNPDPTRNIFFFNKNNPSSIKFSLINVKSLNNIQIFIVLENVFFFLAKLKF